MKIIVHAGMHKTGSTALQFAFHKAAGQDYAYLYYDDPNVSRALTHCFADEDGLLQNAHILRTVSNRDELLAERDRIRANLDQQMRECDHPIMIVSGEGLSINAGDRQRRVAEWLKGYSDDITVITYIRPPLSYMESWFQERLKARYVSLDPRQLFPFYRARLSGLVQNFGHRNCEFVLFDRETLKDGDTIKDFAHRLGVPAPATQEVHGNFSLTAPAICLLYKYRKELEGDALIDQEPLRADRAVVDLLRKVAGPKFRFAASFQDIGDPRFASNKEWMEARMGLSLDEERSDNPDLFATEDDLLSGAEEARRALHSAMDHSGIATGADLIEDFKSVQAHMLEKVRIEMAKEAEASAQNHSENPT